MRYLGIIEYDRRPPKSWAKRDMSYFADRVARKAKNVTESAVSTYRHRGWFLVKVRTADTAEQAREVLRRAMHGSEVAQRGIEVLSNRENLIRWSSPSRRDVLDDLHATHEDDPDEPDFTIKGTKVSDDPMSAIFMGMGPEGVTYEVSTTVPFEVGGVQATRRGFAGLGAITVEMTSPKPGDLIHLARDIAVAFARDHDLVFELHNPSRGSQSRRRRFRDQNPKSRSFGNNKMGYPTVWAFEVPHNTMRRLPPESRALFEYGSRGGRWPASKVKEFLGLDRTTPLRRNAGDLFGGDGFEGFEGFDIDDGNDEGDDLEAARNLDRGDKFYLGRARRTVFRVIGKKGAYVGTVQKPLVVDGSGERVLYELDAVKLGSDEEATVFGVFRIGGSGQRLDDAPFKKGELSVL